jgi:hypothetical protein
MIIEIGTAGFDGLRELYWQQHATGSVRWDGRPRLGESSLWMEPFARNPHP